MNNKPWIQATIVCALFLITLLSIQWYKSLYLRAFIDTQLGDNERWFHYSDVAPSLEKLLQVSRLNNTATAPVTLIHFWDPHCFCHQISHRHFQAVIQAFSSDELRVIVIPKLGENSSNIAFKDNQRHIEFAPHLSQYIPDDFPVSPATAIFTAKGELAYFGPYGFGAFCSLRPDNLLIDVVNRIQQQEPSKFMNVIGDGCFCDY